MGWLGWTPVEVLATDVNLIEMALASRSDLLSTIFGSGKKRPTGERGRKITADRFKAFASRQNERQERGGQ